MTEFSETARKLAARSRGVTIPDTPGLDDIGVGEGIASESPSVAPHQNETKDSEPRADAPSPTALPSAVPLDRRRDVLLSDMDNREVNRAFEQAQTRISKIDAHDPNWDRYMGYFDALAEEIHRRGGPGADIPIDSGEDPVASAEPDPESDRPRFGSHPADTPESPLI